MIIFLIVGVIGIILTTISLVLSDVIDISFGDIGFSGTSIGIGAIVFGAVGALVTINSPASWLGLVVAILGGLAAMVGIDRALRHLARTDDATPHSVIGLHGIATSPIGPSSGEVALEGPSEVERRLAWSFDQIPHGQRVVVVEESGGKIRVEPATNSH